MWLVATRAVFNQAGALWLVSLPLPFEPRSRFFNFSYKTSVFARLRALFEKKRVAKPCGGSRRFDADLLHPVRASEASLVVMK